MKKNKILSKSVGDKSYSNSHKQAILKKEDLISSVYKVIKY